MTRQEWCNFRGWKLPKDENGADEGYLIEYVDGGKANTSEFKGYVSWSPKDVFEKAYRCSGEMTFGDALDRLKAGSKMARKGWNGSFMFAYLVQGGSFPARSEAIKGIFQKDLVPYRPYFALKTAQNDVATWVPSGSDILANDWEVVN